MIALSQLPGAAWRRQDAAALIRDGFCGNAIVYRCVRMIAEAAASIPLVSGDTDVARLLKAPSPDQAGRNLLEQLYADLQMTGNAWAEAVALGDDPAPRAIFALRGDSVRTMSDARGHASGVAVRTARGERIIVREADGWSRVLHLKLYNPTDPHAGFAPLAAARKALDLHNGAAGWAKALIDNAARPSGALVYGKDGGQLTDEQFDRLKSELANEHAGAVNAGRPLFAGGRVGLEADVAQPGGHGFPGNTSFRRARNCTGLRCAANAAGYPRGQYICDLQGGQYCLLAPDRAATGCVLIDEALMDVELAPEEAGLSLEWTANEADPISFVYENRAGLAWSVGHLRALASGTGWALSWTRRGPDIPASWALPEAENDGRFRVETFLNGQLVETMDMDGAGANIGGAADSVRVGEIGPDGRGGHWSSIPLSSP